MAVTPWYATVQSIKAALDAPAPSRLDRMIAESLAASTYRIDRDLAITLPGSQQGGAAAPWTGTRYFDWPSAARAGTPAWKLWLDGSRLLSLTSVTTGGVAVATADVLPGPVNSGPPYRWLELSLSGDTGGFTAGQTWQRSVAVAGLWGEGNVEVAIGAAAAAMTDTTGTALTVNDSSAVGVGSLVRVDSERMVVTAMRAADTGVNTAGALTANKGETAVPVDDGTGIHVDEMITIGSERMRVLDVIGNTLTVQRAREGTVLAAHASPLDVYAPRALTVTRGAQGTTAATHALAAVVYVWDCPPLLADWCRGETLNTVQQKLSAYGRTIGAGATAREATGAGLEDLRCAAMRAHGRTMRAAAV